MKSKKDSLLKKAKKEERILNWIQKHGRDILESKKFISSANSIQHGEVSVLQHSIHVAKCSLKFSKKLPFRFNEKDIVRGALLHDYFQYDWHERKTRVRSLKEVKNMHGFQHPRTALLNAKKEFLLSKRQEDIIQKHMWPLTIKPPRYREAWVVTMADKYCSLLETFYLHKKKPNYNYLVVRQRGEEFV